MNKVSIVNLILVCSAAFVANSTSTAEAAEWGSLKGRFVIDGKPADPPPLPVDTKEPYCVEKKPKNEAWVVGADGSLKNGIVYLRLPRRGKIDIHPDYEAGLKEPAVLDNHLCSFVPHVTLVRVGQSLVIKNSDPPPVGHNTNISMFAFNQTIPSNSETQIKVAKDGPLPMPVVCNIHPFMKGYLLAQEHPYMTASGDDGSFEIKNIPAGKHEFQFWHEAAGYLRDLKLASGKTNRQGRADLTITAGKTLDVGEIKIPARMMK